MNKGRPPFWDDAARLDALHKETSSPEALRDEALDGIHPAFRPFKAYPDGEYREAVRKVLERAPDEIWDVASRIRGRVPIRGIGEATWVEVLFRIGAVLSAMKIRDE